MELENENATRIDFYHLNHSQVNPIILEIQKNIRNVLPVAIFEGFRKSLATNGK